jgi:nitrite reductase/ring-hydroxylating ferredoxin subunit
MKFVVARFDEFQPGERRIVNVNGRSIGVFRVDDQFYAIRNRCPHQGGPLCEGRVFPRALSEVPGEIDLAKGAPLLACPWHGWEYDLETGQSWIGASEPRVGSYPVSVEQGGALAALLDAARSAAPGETGQLTPQPGPYIAETVTVRVEDQYVVLDA